MACARVALATGVCATIAFTLMGCNGSDYDTCDKDDMVKKTLKFQADIEKCVHNSPGSMSDLESCGCAAYKPWATEMKKYKKACKGGDLSPLKLHFNGHVTETTCGLSLATSTAPIEATAISDGELVASAKLVAATPTSLSSPQGEVSASAAFDRSIGQPAQSEDEGAGIGALEKAMWASTGALFMGAACLAARWRSGARDVKMGTERPELELSGTPATTA